MQYLQLTAVDSLFMRDGTPFDAGGSAQHDVGGMFPPHPRTMAGALRAALARQQGWNGRGPWPQSFHSVLGNGPHDLGTVSILGPFLARQNELLFRAPSHVLGQRIPQSGAHACVSFNPSGTLAPGPRVLCDLGPDVRLPSGPMGEAHDSPDGFWINLAGLNALLCGTLPSASSFVGHCCLWTEEPRVGLQRDPSTRTATQGMLYSTRHVRLRRGVRLIVGYDGVPPDWSIGESLMELGGESRCVDMQPWSVGPTLNTPATLISTHRRVLLLVLTPTDLDAEEIRGQTPLRSFPGSVRLVSVCSGPSTRIGGWDSLSGRPLPMRSYLPAGAVLFCSIENPDELLQHVPASGIAFIGRQRACGFGAVAMGYWDDKVEVSG